MTETYSPTSIENALEESRAYCDELIKALEESAPYRLDEYFNVIPLAEAVIPTTRTAGPSSRACAKCGNTWQPPAVRGRPFKTCVDCR